MDESTCICSMAEYYDVSVGGERKKKGSCVKMIFSDHPIIQQQEVAVMNIK